MEAQARLAAHYLETVRATFEGQKRQAERAMAQLEPEQLHQAPDAESNSVAVIVKHLAGNMRSRWTDLLTRDGEKPDRDRDSEFVDDPASPDAVLARWEEGWAVLFAALDDLAPDDLLARVVIRGQEHTVLEAIERQASHYAAHVGQIVYLAKHLAGARWRTLSIPRGGSDAYRPDARDAEAPAGRSTREVIEDHLALRIEGDPERDVERNFHPDVVVLHVNGTVHGHDGVRTSSGRLREQLPDARFEVRALHVHGAYAYLEWSARSERYRVDDGADSFVVRGGRIAMQSIHYTLEE